MRSQDEVANFIKDDEYRKYLHAHTKYYIKVDLKILKLIEKGYTAREISGIIFLSRSVIEYRILKLKESFNCKSLSQLIAKMIRLDII